MQEKHQTMTFAMPTPPATGAAATQKPGRTALCFTIGYVCVCVAVIHAPTASVLEARDTTRE
jgi:hypothetical protein